MYLASYIELSGTLLPRGHCHTYPPLGKLVTEKPVDFVGFDNVVEFNKNRQNDDNVVKAYKDLFSWNLFKKKPVNWLKSKCLYYML